jgi:hypothetical protein
MYFLNYSETLKREAERTEDDDVEFIEKNSEFINCNLELESDNRPLSRKLIAVDDKKFVFWNITPCGSCKNRSFEGTYRLHHQGDKNRRATNVSCFSFAACFGC